MDERTIRMHNIVGRATSWFVLVLLGGAVTSIACGGQQIDTTVCTPDETLCGASCAALYKDPQNCGACGTVCSQGTVCFHGACATSCGGGTIQCGQSCVDPEVDRDNCGGCGTQCSSGEACAGGACSSTCVDGQTLCALDGGAAYCANTQTDNANCGGCGTSCGPEETCANGNCTSSCAPSQTLCVPNDASPYCTDVDTDPNNCGTCGTSCSTHAYCAGGACTCEAGYTMCGGACVSIATDASNCGACGTICTGTCDTGRCVVDLTGTAAGPIAIDANNVYGTDSSAGTVLQVPKAGGPGSVLSTAAQGAEVIATDGAYVYWAAGHGNYWGISYTPVGGGTIATVASNLQVVSIAAGSSYVYFTTVDSVSAFPSGGGAINTLTSSEASPDNVVTAASMLYWTTETMDIRKMATWNPYPVTLTSAPKNVGAGMLSTDGTNVYFTPDTQIRSVSVYGGAQTVLASGLASGGRWIANDAINIYWVDGKGVWRVATAGGTVTYVCSPGGYPSGPIAVDGTSVYWSTGTGLRKVTPK